MLSLQYFIYVKLTKGLQIEVIKDELPTEAIIDNNLIWSISEANVILVSLITFIILT
jgi:hypothetical protein